MDDEEAFEMAREACEKGDRTLFARAVGSRLRARDARAVELLGLSYFFDCWSASNVRKAEALLRRAVALGSVSALHNLGTLLLMATPRDTRGAIECYREAREQGFRAMPDEAFEAMIRDLVEGGYSS